MESEIGSAGEVTRREVLRRAGAAGLVLSGGSLALAACGSSSSSTASTTGGAARRGGKLRVGMITGGKSETLSVPLVTDVIGQARTQNLYEPLFFEQADGTTVPWLAKAGSASSNGKVWTLELRNDVEFHSGKKFNADDVLYTIRSWKNPASLFNPVVGTVIDFAGVRKRGSFTVEVPLHLAVAEFPSLLTWFNALVIPDGFKDFSKPDGTGPFRFESFTPGQISVFQANRSYWRPGLPYVDSLVIDTSFTSEQARTNALLSGNIDIAPSMDYALAKANKTSGQIRVSSAIGPAFQTIYMRTDVAPFNDVRVRQALRLVADRPVLVENALLGFGTVGNDVPGHGLRYYDNSLTRVRDVEKAKSLLKAAGQQNLNLTLKTSAVAPGVVESATLFASQAKDAGVNINLQRVDTSTYFSPASGWLKYSFAQDFYPTIPSLSLIWLVTLVTGCAFPETHWGDPKSDALLHEALGALDTTRATELWAEVQKLQFDRGGNIIWGVEGIVDGYANKVSGLDAAPSGPAANFDFKRARIGA